MKTGDYCIRHIAALLMFCGQVFIPTLAWTVIKCFLLLPMYLSRCFSRSLALAMTTVIALLTRAVEIGDSIHKFIVEQQAMPHLFNRLC